MCMASAPSTTALPDPPRRSAAPATQPAIAAQSRDAIAAGDDQHRRLRAAMGQQRTVLTSASGLGAARTKKTLLGG